MVNTRVAQICGVLILLVATVGTFTGCTEAQRQTLDNVAADVNTVSTSGQDIMQGPLGDMVPEKARDPIAIGLAVAGAVATAWQTWRKKQTTETLRSVAKGVENSPPEHAGEVKARIEEAMLKSNMNTATQRQIVSRAKS